MPVHHVFLGQYSFLVVPSGDAADLSFPGVYAFIQTRFLWPDPLYIGIAEDFSTRARPGHDKWDRAISLGMSNLVVFWQPDETLRREMEMELIETYQPPLKVKFNEARRLGSSDPLVGVIAESLYGETDDKRSRLTAKTLYESDLDWTRTGALHPKRLR